MELDKIKNEIIESINKELENLQATLVIFNVETREYKTLITQIFSLIKQRDKIRNINNLNIISYFKDLKQIVENNSIIINLNDMQRNLLIKNIETHRLKQEEIHFSLDIPDTLSFVRAELVSADIDIKNINNKNMIKNISLIIDNNKSIIYNAIDEIHKCINLYSIQNFNQIEYKINNGIMLDLNEVNVFEDMLNNNDKEMFNLLKNKINLLNQGKSENYLKDSIKSLQEIIYKNFIVNIKKYEDLLNINCSFDESIETRVLNLFIKVNKIRKDIDEVKKQLIQFNKMFMRIDEQKRKDLFNIGLLDSISFDYIYSLSEENIYDIINTYKIYEKLLSNSEIRNKII